MKRHFYIFSYEIELNNGHANGDIQLSFNLKLRPEDIKSTRDHITSVNKKMNPLSIVFKNIFYIGEFEE